MIYDFDTVVDRSGNRSAKYDERKNAFGREDVIPLWIADMDFKTAQPVIDALKARAEEGIWGYTSRPDSYFEAVRDWQTRRNGWTPDVRLMSYCLGIVQALSAMVYNFTAPGEGVSFLSPVYMDFYDVANAWERPIYDSHMVEKNGVWEIDYDDLSEKLDKSKLFIFCNPHNPMGKVWRREEIARVAELCLGKGVLMVSDEIHSDLVFFGNRHINAVTAAGEAAAKNIITCTSATKTFNMAGLQAATVIFPDGEKKAVFDNFWKKMDIHRNNAFSLTAVETAFREGEEWLEQLKSYIEGNFLFVRDYCEKYIPRIKPNLPQATYLIWLDCRELGLDNAALSDFMINRAGLGLTAGSNFSPWLTGYMRLNAACPRSVLEKALTQLKKAVDEL